MTSLLDSFCARATRVGAVVHRPSSPSEVLETIDDLLRSREAGSAAVSPDLGPLAAQIADALRNAGITSITDFSVESVALADAGISPALMGVAETGSIVLAGNELVPRLISMLPSIHVVLLDRRAVVNTLGEAGEKLRTLSTPKQGALSRYASIVTGPSRTADVEKTLSVGVHGPRELHVIISDHSGAES
ncbi:MAG TPA: lactate utilization protein [Chloroflexota bacterium]|nr:lactate utilization protein [Chloroflexota bacterium]